MPSNYEKYKKQQVQVYAKSKPIKDWRKQMKNPKSNLELLELVKKIGPAHGIAYDLGCGEGYHTEDLRNMGYQAYGIELSEKRVRDGHRFGRNYIQVGDFHHLPWYPDAAALVFMHETIEHSAYPEKVLKEVYRVLKPGGHFVLSCPLEGHWKGRQADMNQHNLNAQDNHVWKATVQDLNSTLETAGFTNFEIRLYSLNSVKFQFIYDKKNPRRIDKFRPHALVVGKK